MKDETSTEVATGAPSVLPVLPDPEMLKEIAEANLGGIDPNKQLFEVIKMPMEGRSFGQCPVKEKATPEEQISGVILGIIYRLVLTGGISLRDAATARPDCSKPGCQPGIVAKK